MPEAPTASTASTGNTASTTNPASTANSVSTASSASTNGQHHETDIVPTVLLISTSDTDLLSARASGAPYRLANPNRVKPEGLAELLDGVSIVVVRLLGGRRAWEDGLDALLADGRPVVVLSGEALPDAALMQLSTAPVGVAAQSHGYLVEGGPANLTALHAFLCDTLLLTGYGFTAPEATPVWGVLERPQHRLRDFGTRRPVGPGPRPTVAVLYYRAHHVAGNTGFVEALCCAVEAAGRRGSRR